MTNLRSEPPLSASTVLAFSPAPEWRVTVQLHVTGETVSALPQLSTDTQDTETAV